MESDIAKNELALQTPMIQKEVFMGALPNNCFIKRCKIARKTPVAEPFF